MTFGIEVANAADSSHKLNLKERGIYIESSRMKKGFTSDFKISQAENESLLKEKLNSRKPAGKVLSATKVKDNAPVSGSSIEGDWIFVLGDWYFGSINEDFGFVQYPFTATYFPEDKMVLFEDLSDYVMPFVGEVDEETGIISFSRFYIGSTYSYMGEIFIYQEPFEYNYTTKSLDNKDIEGVYNEEEGSITFQSDQGVAWAIYYDMEGTEFSDYYMDIFDFVLANKNKPADNNPDDWKDVGNALFMDGWLLPRFDIDQTKVENCYEVPLQQNKTNPGLYRLVNPYKYGPAAEYNVSTADGFIEFDVTDPNHVRVNENGVDAGFVSPELGITKFYCFNSLVFYHRYLGDPIDEIIEVFENDMPVTTFRDGVVSLTYYDDPYWGREYDANFGHQRNPEGGVSWADANGNPLDCTARITFPGYFDSNSVSKVEFVNEDAAVYYNVNGVRVENPVRGGIYIVRKGEKVTKVIK